jgi:hypothetical protein
MTSKLFNKGKLKHGNKNHRYIAFLLACSITFIRIIVEIPDGGGSMTIFAFFKALVKAVKEGRISKILARMLISRLEKEENIHIRQDLKEAVQKVVAA